MPGENLHFPERGEAMEKLQQNLDRLTFMGDWGISIVDGTGQPVYLQHQERPFYAASVNKLLPVLYAYTLLDQESYITLASPLEGGGRYDEGGDLQAREDARITVGEAIEDSIVNSGNTAAKSLILSITAESVNAFVRHDIGIHDSYVEQSGHYVSFGATTPNDMIKLLQYASWQAPGVIDLLARSIYSSGLRRYLPSKQNNLMVGTKYGAVNEEGVRHEVGFVRREGSNKPEDTLFCAVFSQSRVPKLATNIISLIGAEIYERYFGVKAVPALGKVAVAFMSRLQRSGQP